MTVKEKIAAAKKIVEYFNPDMGGKWDTEMYRQKYAIINILNDETKIKG
jgi:hypothetical protein